VGRTVLKPDQPNLRVLQLAPRAPWPLDTGAKLRNYHLARVLAPYASVSLLAFAESRHDKTELANVYEQVITAPRDQGYSLGNLLRGAVGRTPLPLLNYTTEEMKHELAGTLKENDFNIIQLESIHLMNYLPVIWAARKRPLVICDWHNVESDLMRQYAESQTNIARKTYARRTARLMSQHEQQALDEFDAHIVVSEHDAERLRRVNSDARVLVIENGVDLAYYKDVDSTTEKNRIVFVGSMDYHANIEGAINFARTAWPSVHEKNRRLIFTIVGRDPAPAVRELATIAGVEVTGSVEDVRPYYREAVLAVVPLNVGGGSRLKILEAMAAGVPVASTARGAEGLHVTDGQNILLADSNDELARAIISLLGEPDLRAQIISGGRELVTNRYDWSTLGSKLFDYYRELLQERPVKPQP
jgi:sugar transferase (PEP-CTERM/EpsH1 system associated)